jgi:hypothetical protein
MASSVCACRPSQPPVCQSLAWHGTAWAQHAACEPGRRSCAWERRNVHDSCRQAMRTHAARVQLTPAGRVDDDASQGSAGGGWAEMGAGGRGPREALHPWRGWQASACGEDVAAVAVIMARRRGGTRRTWHPGCGMRRVGICI